MDNELMSGPEKYKGPTITTACMISELRMYAGGMAKPITRDMALAIAERLDAMDYNMRVFQSLTQKMR